MPAMRSSYGSWHRLRGNDPGAADAAVTRRAPHLHLRGIEKAYPEVGKRQEAMTISRARISRRLLWSHAPSRQPTGKASRWGWTVRSSVSALYGPGFAGPARTTFRSAGSALSAQPLAAHAAVGVDQDPAQQGRLRVRSNDPLWRARRGGKIHIQSLGPSGKKFATVLLEYAKFSADYFKRTGYRIDVMDVGYKSGKTPIPSSSYTYDGTTITIDPVVSTAKGWRESRPPTMSSASRTARSRCSISLRFSPASR